jgi:hypothetical protein
VDACLLPQLPGNSLSTELHSATIVGHLLRFADAMLRKLAREVLSNSYQYV